MVTTAMIVPCSGETVRVSQELALVHVIRAVCMIVVCGDGDGLCFRVKGLRLPSFMGGGFDSSQLVNLYLATPVSILAQIAVFQAAERPKAVRLHV